MFEARNLTILNKANKFVFVDVSFIINPGEIWMLRGQNGIGKSSIFEALIGILNIYAGKIFLNSVELNSLESAKRVQLGLKYVPQLNALLDTSIINNLKICADYLLPYSERKQAIEKAIEMFFLNEIAYKRPEQLSGGQRRLAELSKIVIGPAHLVLMDEPFAAIDETMTENVSQIFVKLKTEENYSFLLNDHNIKAVQAISDCHIHITNAGTKIKLASESLLS